jgi:hypothetical protein
LSVRLGQFPDIDQVRPAQPRPPQRLLAPPAGNPGVVARHQHRRDRAELMFDRSREVRAIQQPVLLEAVLGCRLAVVQRTLLEPGDGVHHHARCQFATRQDVVTDGQLFVDLGGDQALIDALVAAAEQDQAIPRGQFTHFSLGQALALGRQVEDVRRRWIGRARRGEASAQGIDQHHHARPAAEWPFVDAAVIAAGVVARVPAMDGKQVAFLRTPHDAVCGDLRDEFREQADHVDAHGRQKSASQSTVTIPESKSTERM